MRLCCGFEVQKPTQALMSVKGSANTCDLIPKWARSLAVGNCSWDINRAPHPLHKKIIQISKLIFDTLLWCGFLDLKPTAECQISTLVLAFFYGGRGVYRYPM
jgi:hypothetical protein